MKNGLTGVWVAIIFIAGAAVATASWHTVKQYEIGTTVAVHEQRITTLEETLGRDLTEIKAAIEALPKE